MANVKFYIQGDNSSAIRAMNQVQGAVKNVAGTLNNHLKGALIGAFGAAAITETVRRTMEYADNVDEASSRIDVGIEKLQEWTFAAKQSGAAMEDIVSFTEKLTAFAASGKGAIKLEAQGINPNQTPEKLVESVWKKVNGQAPGSVTPFLKEVGGRSASKLYNTFQNDLESVSKSARALGAVMDTATVVKLAALNDQFSILTQVIYSNVGPALLQLARWAYGFVLKTQGGVEKVATTAGVVGPQLLDKWNTLSGKEKTDRAVNTFADGIPLVGALFKMIRKDDKNTLGNDIKDILEKNQPELDKEYDDIDTKRDEAIKAYDEAQRRAAEAARNRGTTRVSQRDTNNKGYSLTELKNPSPFVSIGGLAGVNTQFRLERINKDMLKELQKITVLLEKETTSTEQTLPDP